MIRFNAAMPVESDVEIVLNHSKVILAGTINAVLVVSRDLIASDQTILT